MTAVLQITLTICIHAQLILEDFIAPYGMVVFSRLSSFEHLNNVFNLIAAGIPIHTYHISVLLFFFLKCTGMSLIKTFSWPDFQFQHVIMARIVLKNLYVCQYGTLDGIYRNVDDLIITWRYFLYCRHEVSIRSDTIHTGRCSQDKTPPKIIL